MTVGGILRKQTARFLELGLHSFLAGQQSVLAELFQMPLARCNRPLGLLHDALGMRDLAPLILGRSAVLLGGLLDLLGLGVSGARQFQLERRFVGHDALSFTFAPSTARSAARKFCRAASKLSVTRWPWSKATSPRT